MSEHPPLSIERTLHCLGNAATQFTLDFVEHCASTNDSLSARPPVKNAMEVLLAHRQTAGRGRRGRSWLAQPGQGLTFSCRWTPPEHAPPLSGLSLSVGLAVAEALQSLGARGIALKWPNDLLANGGKLAGILIELASGQHRTRSVFIGIGLNLRSAPGELPFTATALHAHMDTPPPDEAILARILLRLHARLQDFADGGFACMRDAWQANDAFAARSVRISGEGIDCEGTCEGVDHDGALLLRTSSGAQKRILSGDVSLRVAT